MTNARNRTIRDIAALLDREKWFSGEVEIEFLAAGEYNENYLIRSPAGRSVFRINHGTQLGLDDQISYEFDVLRQVAPSGVTPLPLHLARRAPEFPNGVLLMTYLEGRPLDYQTDLTGAAECFARIHRLDYDVQRGPLLVQEHPVRAIVEECRGLLERTASYPIPGTESRIAAYFSSIERVADDVTFSGERLCITNTEVNSGNFIVDGSRVRLVDWEKAVASQRYQDLGHFLVPTTTLWKSDYRFDGRTRRRFLETYFAAAQPEVSLDELDERTRLLERTILLRAFSWVAMAFAEYQSGSRSIINDDTHATMRHYLEHIDEFLEVE